MILNDFCDFKMFIDSLLNNRNKIIKSQKFTMATEITFNTKTLYTSLWCFNLLVFIGILRKIHMELIQFEIKPITLLLILTLS